MGYWRLSQTLERPRLGEPLLMYKIKRHGPNARIYEEATDQYVATSRSIAKIKRLHKNLVTGGGFQGQTPSFLLSGCHKYGIDLDRNKRGPL